MNSEVIVDAREKFERLFQNYQNVTVKDKILSDTEFEIEVELWGGEGFTFSFNENEAGAVYWLDVAENYRDITDTSSEDILMELLARACDGIPKGE